MLRKMILFVILATIIIGTPIKTSAKTIFNDTESHWAKRDIDFVENKSIIKGYGNGQFGPDDKVTVEQYIIMLVRTLGVDVPNGLDNCIAAAIELGLISSKREFNNYTAPIIRADMARLSIRAYEKLNPNVSYPSYLEAYKGLVEDYDQLKEDVKTNVLKCVEQGLITGDNNGNFVPEGVSTRAQAAAVIHRLLDPIEREAKKPLFADPDPEFEAFMRTEAAAEYCSMLRIDQVVDGRIIWNSRPREDSFSSGEYGVSLFPTYNNREANKVAYNTLRELVGEARKNNNYVVACYLSWEPDDNHEIAYFSYYYTKGAGRKENGQYAFQLTIWLYPHKVNDENKNQKSLTIYEWDIGNLFDSVDSMTKDLEVIRYQTDKYKSPLEKAFKAVYREQTGKQIFMYTMNEYNAANELTGTGKKYENRSVTNINGLEIQNYTYGLPHFGTSKKDG